MYDSDIHHRHSIRLKGYDYSQSGMYFVTICVHEHLHLFGEIVNDKMVLNDAGKMLEYQWNELANRFQNIELNNYIIMPNHMHGIITIVGVPLVGTQNNDAQNVQLHDGQPHMEPHKGQPQGIAPTSSSKTVGDMIGAFKSLTTNVYINNVKNYNWKPFNVTLWQRNYYEHIILNEKSYNNISEYINNNPINWREDRFYEKEIY